MSNTLSPPQAAQLFKLLGDVPRLRILKLLAGQEEMNVTALCEEMGMNQPAVSHHLGLLRMNGLVERRRSGKSNYYSVASQVVTKLLSLVKD